MRSWRNVSKLVPPLTRDIPPAAHQAGAITKVRNMSTSKASQPPAAPADPAQEKAATKIQARSRGKTGRAQTEAIKELFDKTDKNADGQVTRRELLATLGKHDEDSDLRTRLGLPNPKEGGKAGVWAFKDAFDKSFVAMDTDKDGAVSVKEFSDFLAIYKSEAAAERAAEKPAVEKPAEEKAAEPAVDPAPAKSEPKKPAEEEKPAEKPDEPSCCSKSEETAEVPAPAADAPPADAPKTVAAESGRTSPSSVADPTAA